MTTCHCSTIKPGLQTGDLIVIAIIVFIANYRVICQSIQIVHVQVTVDAELGRLNLRVSKSFGRPKLDQKNFTGIEAA
jgi:hypothetical protein